MTATKTAAAFLVGIVACVAVAIAAWFFRVQTSEIKGEGDALIRKNSAQNWTTAQARFESLYAEIAATDRKVTIAKQRLDAHPDDKTAADTYLGTQNVCLSFVADYNAAARTYLAADFRAVDLPAQIDATDPTTDCQE